MRNTKKAGTKRRYDRFRRSEATIDVRPVFLIASEGKNTEPDYFEKILAGLYPKIRMVMLGEKQERGAVKGNDPRKLKRRIQERLLEQPYEGIICEAWLVLDRDEKTWTVEQLNEVAMWVTAENSKKNPVIHGMALSNPCFEFWLLLHFNEGKGAIDNHKCVSMLKKEISHYDGERLDAPNVIKFFSEKAIKEAIKRSEAKNSGLDEDWPRQPGHTTVHVLVQRILDAASNIPR